LSARKTIHPNLRSIEADDIVRKIKTPTLENRKGGAPEIQNRKKTNPLEGNLTDALGGALGDPFRAAW
jgi:hypothetical protein